MEQALGLGLGLAQGKQEGRRSVQGLQAQAEGGGWNHKLPGPLPARAQLDSRAKSQPPPCQSCWD